jgi:hypothetical protein
MQQCVMQMLVEHNQKSTKKSHQGSYNGCHAVLSTYAMKKLCFKHRLHPTACSAWNILQNVLSPVCSSSKHITADR